MSKSKKKQLNGEQPVVEQVTDATEIKEQTENTPTELTDEQIEVELNELAATPKRERIWEIDFLRGLMILFVVWDHFMWDVSGEIGSSVFNTKLFQWLHELSNKYYGSLRYMAQPVFVTMFVLTSGISCSFSRSNGKRALKMMSFAILFTAVTFAISSVIGEGVTIYFNVIHVVALSVALYTAIEWIWARCTRNWQKNIFGVAMFAITMTAIVLGGYANEIHKHWATLLFGDSEWLRKVTDRVSTGVGDYLAFLPDFGWFLVGVFLGKLIYKERKTVFPSVDARYVSPVTFCGRHSLWVYFISQIVMFGFIYLLHEMYSVL